jgi:malonyl-CoA/methylmalonyl-CoA synthetase
VVSGATTRRRDQHADMVAEADARPYVRPRHSHGIEMTANLFSLLQSHFPADATRTFLTGRDGGQISYGDLLDRSARLANLLVARGVRPGDRVAAQVAKSPEALLLYLATLRAGAVYLPLNPAYTSGEVAYFLGNAEPALFVCDGGNRAALEAAARQAGVRGIETLDSDGSGSLVDAAAAQPASFADVPRDRDDLAAILYTSGTTGRSKGAMLSHHNLASNAQALWQAWRFTERDVLLHALPIFHTHGLFVATNLMMLTGGSMIFLPAFDAAEVLRLLPGATTMMGVPTFYTRLLAEQGLTRDLVGHMRLFISGSAPLSAETHREFAARTGHAILERYGMTETNMNTSNPYDGERRPGTVGSALPGVEVRIADPETGRVVPDGVGVIEVRGDNVFKGYWRMPDKTAAEFRADGFFISGDLGRFDEDGYLHIVGRARDLIISGGVNVYPAEVEAAIEALPDVAECAAIGVPHPDFGEGVVAVVVARGGAALSEERLIGGLADTLARFKQPKRLFILDELPRNAMGKIRKDVLRGQFADCFKKPG